MLREPAAPLAVFTIFVLGIEAIIGLVLGLSDGLSELHKTVLVTFVCAFPVVTLALLWQRLPLAAPPIRDGAESGAASGATSGAEAQGTAVWKASRSGVTAQPAE
jgi:Na+/proline symporter